MNLRGIFRGTNHARPWPLVSKSEYTCTVATSLIGDLCYYFDIICRPIKNPNSIILASGIGTQSFESLRRDQSQHSALILHVQVSGTADKLRGHCM
jgi:hypothetical protein